MKKTASLIYRLIFLIISVWALWSWTGFSSRTFSDMTVFSDTVNAVAVAVVFLWSIKSAPPEVLLRFKAVCAVLAAAVLFLNRGAWYGPVSLFWIIKILLPALAVLDWLIFDKKGSLKIFDILTWLLAALGLLSLLGLDPKAALFSLFPALALGGLFLLLDSLLSGKKGKNGIFSLIFRLLFLILEAYAFYLLSGLSVEKFIHSLKFYTSIANLLCFAVVAVVLITGITGFKKASEPLTRIKGCFTVLALIAAILYFALLRQSPLGTYHLIHSVICPFMMLLDWILFDKKGCFKMPDPLWWTIPVFAYAAYIAFISIPVFGDYIYAFSYIPYLVFAIFGLAAIVLGYIILSVDKLLGRN